MQKIELKEKVNGFSERDIHSKAILTKDNDALLSYKIQRNRFNKMRENTEDVQKMKTEIGQMRNELSEIKELLLKLTAGNK